MGAVVPVFGPQLCCIVRPQIVVPRMGGKQASIASKLFGLLGGQKPGMLQPLVQRSFDDGLLAERFDVIQ